MFTNISANIYISIDHFSADYEAYIIVCFPIVVLMFQGINNTLLLQL